MSDTAIHHHQFDPRQPTIFGKNKANERATATTIFCSNPDCPLLAAGQCVMRTILGGGRCPYGRVQTKTGPTKRAASLSKWLAENTIDAPQLTYPPKKLAFIGDYVYLPYAHMDMCKEVAFLSHSAFIVSGNPFLPREHWTIDAVETLVLFRPRAMMGVIIPSYQREVVPLFVQHLREVDPAMFAKLVKRQPQFDAEPDYVGRTALLRTLASPIKWRAHSGKHSREYPVVWTWDGERLTTTSVDAYHKTWGNMDVESIELVAIPKPDATLTVMDNSWVTGDTEFVD